MKLAILTVGVIIGILVPYAVDFAMFGDPTPCTTVTRYEDGSTVVNCSVKH